MIMSISHPWPRATGEYAALGPHYVALGPQDAARGILGASGDIMLGPWAAYSPVSLCQGCDIIPISTSLQVSECRDHFRKDCHIQQRAASWGPRAT